MGVAFFREVFYLTNETRVQKHISGFITEMLNTEADPWHLWLQAVFQFTRHLFLYSEQGLIGEQLLK